MSVVMSIKQYFVTSIEECKKITWPSREDARKYTVAVIAMSVGMAIFLGALDYALTLGFEKLFLQIK